MLLKSVLNADRDTIRDGHLVPDRCFNLSFELVVDVRFVLISERCPIRDADQILDLCCNVILQLLPDVICERRESNKKLRVSCIST